MPLTDYDNLTGEQKIKITKMYADLSDLRAYLYDWDDAGYHGRRPKPKEEKFQAVAVDATDAARKLAQEKDISLMVIKGTGVNGRVLLSDVEKYVK